MNKKLKYLILSFLIAVVFLSVLGFPRQHALSRADGERLYAAVQRGELSVSIHTVGLLDAAKSHMVSFDIRGNTGKIIFLIKDGSWVKEGDILVRLDPSPFEKEVRRLQGKIDSLTAAVEANDQLVLWEKNQVSQNIAAREYDLKVARLDLERLVKGEGPLQLAQYQEEMGKAKAEHDRYASFHKEIEKLGQEGFKNPAELVRAKENAQTYGEKYEAAKRRFVSYKEYVLPSMEEAAKAKVENSLLVFGQSKQAAVFKIANVIADLTQAKAHLKTVESSLAIAREELEKTVLRAPFSGITILYEAFRDGQKRKPREGDTVLMHQPILYLPDISKLIVRTKVREVDLHKVQVGQQASVLIDAYPALSFQAEVQFIGALAAGNGSGSGVAKYFQVVLTLTGKDMRLRPGMTAQVLINAENAENALLLPVQAVFQDDSGHPFCYLFSLPTDEIRKIPVAIGRENEIQVEILSGLKQGDRVSLTAPSQTAQ